MDKVQQLVSKISYYNKKNQSIKKNEKAKPPFYGPQGKVRQEGQKGR
jgi:hypothetical protein